MKQAILLELASHDHSPRNHGGWHSWYYKSFFISMEWSVSRPVRPLTLHYRWNSNMYLDQVWYDHVAEKRKYAYSNRGWELPWRLKAACISDVYEHYNGLKTLNKTKNVLAERG